MSGFQWNQTDYKRITERLTKLVSDLRSPAGPVFTYRLRLLNEYKEAIATAMGSVSGAGGPMTLTGDAVLGKPTTVYWAPLSGLTVQLKTHSPFGVSSDVSIWVDTGQTKGAVKVFGAVDALEMYAGIEDQEAIRKALCTEYGEGGVQPARPLFTIANAAFKAHRPQIIAAMREQVRESITRSGWGS